MKSDKVCKEMEAGTVATAGSVILLDCSLFSNLFWNVLLWVYLRLR